MKKQKRKPGVFYYTLKYCLQKKRKDEAHKKLLLAIQHCEKKQELEKVLLFGQFLQEETSIQQAYRKRLLEMDQQTTKKHLSKTS